MKRYRPHVSDHAVVRWLERIQGVDVDAIRERILDPKVRAACEIGATGIKIDGFEYVIERGSVITIQPAKAQPLVSRKGAYE